VITDGTGYLKEKGKPVQILRKNDVITIPAGTLHWHGATAEKDFTQMVINPDTEKGVVNWLHSVSDAEYKTPDKL
jgi:quercetin dioxygenase-like cupin family protein